MNRLAVRRAVVVTCGAALVAGSVSACQSNVGVAARVGGSAISESQIDSHVRSGGPDRAVLTKLRAAVSSATQGQGQVNLPPARDLVLDVEIGNRLAEKSLRAAGGPATRSELSGAAAYVRQSDSGYITSRHVMLAAGVDGSYANTYERFSALRVILARRLKTNSGAALAAYLKRHGGSVSVNPRYGEWDAANQTLDSTGSAGVPDYLKLQPSAAAGS